MSMKLRARGTGLAALAAILIAPAVLAACGDSGGASEQLAEPIIGDAPALDGRTSQLAIDAGEITLDELVDRGRTLFVSSFNTLDGAGRPETTDVGPSNFRDRREFPDNFNRISGPDANTCVACHNLPRPGGGGDNSSNIFGDADRLPFVNFDGAEGDGFEAQTLRSVGVERSAMSLFGVGFVELLAREMTVDLQNTRDEAVLEARASGDPVTRDLSTKGVSFGRITARADGTLDTSEVDGVDADLIVKPMQQKGIVVSLREFGVKAMNSHFGMQAAERFPGDPDRDGMSDEVSRGDLTALVAFLATLPVPGRVIPEHPEARAAAERGEQLFASIGCETCHRSTLRLEDPVFTEPNPFNPPGKLQLSDVSSPFAFDLTLEGPAPHLKREPDGSVLVPVFTDLKRHDMGEKLDSDLIVQNGVPTGEWLTRKLWGIASEPPFLHHGRATLLSEAILMHGGEAQESRDAYGALAPEDQAAVVEFLKVLQVLPEDASEAVITAGLTVPGSGAIWPAVAGGLGGVLLLVLGGLMLAVVKRRGSTGDAA